MASNISLEDIRNETADLVSALQFDFFFKNYFFFFFFFKGFKCLCMGVMSDENLNITGKNPGRGSVRSVEMYAGGIDLIRRRQAPPDFRAE